MEKQKPRVLIVDDEPINVKLLEAIIDPMDIAETYTALNGTQALEMASTVYPDVILLDIKMPDIDGIEVCRRLKENKKTQNIPVVFVTAFTDVEIHASAVEAGGIGFITKPVQVILVEASVRNAIRMKQLSDEVDKLIQHRATLTHMIVHDINNLLSLVISYSGFLLKDKTMSQQSIEDCTLVAKSARNIQFMTRSLLDVEKLESGTLPISIKEINIVELSEQRSQLFQSQARDRSINMELHKPSQDIIVQADEDLLSRVFDNLITNAIKFCSEKGSIEIGFSPGEVMGTVSITNDGAPVPREYHEKIFEKFAQYEVHEATGRKGVGLGLTFCKMALETMKGTITVESPVAGREDGVRFVFQLPVA